MPFRQRYCLFTQAANVCNLVSDDLSVDALIPLAAFDRSVVVRVAWAIDYVCYPVCCGHFHCRARWGALLHQVRLVIVKHIHMLPRI